MKVVLNALYRMIFIHNRRIPLKAMSGDKRGEETFLAKVYKGWRVTIYEPVRESLGLEIGDRVRLTIRKDEAKDKTGYPEENGDG